MQKKPHYHGHRERLRDRFNKVGYLGLHDYELLEMMLYLAIPRGDVKPIAKDLLNEFKTLEGVFHADDKLLQEIEGVGPSTVHALKVVLALHQRILQINIQKGNILSNFSKVLDYCYTHMAFERVEEIRILYLDAKMRLIKDEVHQQGTVDTSMLYIPEVAKRALDLGSLGIILIHNHPSDHVDPSQKDLQITELLEKALTPLNITLHDHIIIGKNKYFSFKQNKLIL
ncbi:MAG: DNA repair protein RadC [Proteobacteria bacterium]|nr:DNA repair protein RadC [Pseudomonadota bacterium]